MLCGGVVWGRWPILAAEYSLHSCCLVATVSGHHCAMCVPQAASPEIFVKSIRCGLLKASIKFGDNGEVIVTGGPPENAKARGLICLGFSARALSSSSKYHVDMQPKNADSTTQQHLDKSGHP